VSDLFSLEKPVTESVPVPGTARVTLPSDPDTASLNEPFAFEVTPGSWCVVKWLLTPKMDTSGWWFPHWWCGPGSRTWTGTAGERPAMAARFPSVEAASKALAGDLEDG
jgi:hypothetical protein